MKITLEVEDHGPPLKTSAPYEVKQVRAAYLTLDICRAYGVLNNMPRRRRSNAADAATLIYALAPMVPWARLAASLQPLVDLGKPKP
jgi:hypothetical protein